MCLERFELQINVGLDEEIGLFVWECTEHFSSEWNDMQAEGLFLICKKQVYYLAGD